ncbi:hypothetical protein MOMUL_10570 [Moorella mulderi DSM 14980]|uniref:Uncharacterized protein n=1 Tax=Moorella mulderi DSM 14980 TaxID=1122241 RepID=A0A151AXT6_9FIRM|nr:hypothetical protein MOMUL_10570 [Moorella mulderi DSM 14980]
MLGLRLRDEFLGPQMPGTTIMLRRPDNTGSTQQSPDRILSITYPTADVQVALRAISAERAGHPIVLLGERGRGKSHIMSVMHHAIESPDRVETWAKEWGERLSIGALQNLVLQRGFRAISEPVHNQEYPLLWELLFDRHPKGELFRGRFQQIGYPYPPRSLIEEMLTVQPVALILDEFQKWFDGLRDEPGPEGIKYRTWAENFIQNLSEISKERPDLLILVISVLNNNTEAFRQVHRVGPVLIDFRGPTAKQDRQKLVIYRLFENRENIPTSDIRHLTAPYAAERYRLLFSHLPESERGRVAEEVVACWPFSPELLELLEDQILMAEAAQQNRDLIRILAQVYRARGEEVPIITPADFLVDDDSCGVQSLLDSISASAHHERLREIARRNLETIEAAGTVIPHARELVSALWVRSMSPWSNAGGTRQELHLDITRREFIDDNAFQSEIVQLIENSINIHGEESPEGRLRFGIEENPRSRVRATARNDRFWQPGPASVAGQVRYPGKDIEHIRNTLRHILVPADREPPSRVIVLGPDWVNNPWSDIDETDRPGHWERPVLILVPDPLQISEGRIQELGVWLARHVSSRRNTVRFLLPELGSKGLYRDAELLFCARCSYLTSIAWKNDPKYRALKDEFDKPLREALKKRFDRFAILKSWDYRNPEQCIFEVERINAQGEQIPSAVEKRITEDLFDPEAFQELLMQRAGESFLVGKLLDELVEPPPAETREAIPYLGDTRIYEEILKAVARGKLVVNVGGTWVGRLPEHVDDGEALRYVRSKAFRSGLEMREVQLGLPSSVGGVTVTAPPAGTATIPSAQETSVLRETAPVSFGRAIQLPVGGPAVETEPSGVQKKTCLAEEPNTGINLCGYFEKWRLSAEHTLDKVKLEFQGLTVQQVKQILQRLPSFVRASLEVTYREEGKDDDRLSLGGDNF